jgi:hypothetical protein
MSARAINVAAMSWTLCQRRPDGSTKMTGDAVWSAASFSCRANINSELSDQICVEVRQSPLNLTYNPEI